MALFFEKLVECNSHELKDEFDYLVLFIHHFIVDEFNIEVI